MYMFAIFDVAICFSYTSKLCAYEANIKWRKKEGRQRKTERNHR